MWSPSSPVTPATDGATLAAATLAESGAAVDEAIPIIATTTTTAVAAAVRKPRPRPRVIRRGYLIGGEHPLKDGVLVRVES
jgi:hypothetical protein